MVAYSFQQRFVAPIRNATKCQTIRAHRKRHAMPGETLQLYTGMRTRQCGLIGIAQCHSIQPIQIDLANATIRLPDATLKPLAGIDDFARQDGFTDWQDMRGFWEERHPGIAVFAGWLITWAGITLAADAAVKGAGDE